MKKGFGLRILPVLMLLMMALNPAAPSAQGEKRDFDLSQTRWSYDPGAPFIYDGQEQEVVLLGLPAGLEVARYEDNRSTLPGERLARAIFQYDAGLYRRPEVPPLAWSILLPAPEGMQLAGSREGVLIQWTPPPYADGVEIHRSPLMEERFERVYFGKDMRFLDRGAAYGQAYQYRMRSYVAQSAFLGLYHHGAFGPALDLVCLDPPHGLAAQRLAEGGGVALAWEPVAGARAYLVTRADRPDSALEIAHQFEQVFEPAFTDSLPFAGEAAYYRVAACLMGQEGPVPGPASAWLCLSLGPDTGIPGDANNDGRVDPLDLICLSDYLAQGIPCPSMGNADANGSGGEPDLADLVYIANLIVGH